MRTVYGDVTTHQCAAGHRREKGVCETFSLANYRLFWQNCSLVCLIYDISYNRFCILHIWVSFRTKGGWGWKHVVSITECMWCDTQIIHAILSTSHISWGRFSERRSISDFVIAVLYHPWELIICSYYHINYMKGNEYQLRCYFTTGNKFHNILDVVFFLSR